MKKLSVLFTLIMVIAVMSCMMIPSFADEVTADAETSAAEETAEETAAAEDTTEETSAETTAAEETTEETEAETTVAEEAAEEEDHAGHDHNGNGIPDDMETENGWEEIGVGEIIAIAVAVVLAVGTVTAILLLAPKKSKQK